MSIDELLVLMEKEKATPRSLKDFEDRQKKRDEEYKNLHQPITNEWLNRQYDI